MTIISKHAEKRLRKRLSIPKASVEENFDKALKNGRRQKHFKGAFKRYLDYWARKYNSTPIVYGNTIYFVINDTLVTAWPVPQKFAVYLKEKKTA